MQADSEALIVAGCPRQRASLAPSSMGAQSQKSLQQLETYQRQSLFLLRPQGGAGAPHRPVQAPSGCHLVIVQPPYPFGEIGP